MLRSLVFLAATLSHFLLLVSTTDYKCIRVDWNGVSGEITLNRKDKLACERNTDYRSCTCEYISVNCLVGPDSLGNFESMTLSMTYANSCDREKCICSSHDNYLEIAQERLATAQTLSDR